MDGTISYTLCTRCDGMGGNCPVCFGEGLLAHESRSHTAADEEEAENECVKCGGSGEVDGETCSRCDGTGVEPEPGEDDEKQAERKVAKMQSATRVLALIELRSRAISIEQKVSFAKATEIALTEDPGLYRDYLDAREASTLTQGDKRKFLAEMQTYLAAQGRGTAPDTRRTAPLPTS